MADEFDALWDSTEAGATYSAPTAAPAQVDLTFDDVWDQTPATPTGAMPVLGQIEKGLTFGYGDEIEGGTYALANALGNVLGLGNERSMAENYNAMQQFSEGEDAAYTKANPGKAILLQMGGGVLPAVGGGIMAAATKAPVAAPGILSTLGKYLYGAGFEKAPSVVQLVQMGLTQGALYGSGEAGAGNRIEGALKGGAFGMVAAPVLGKTLETVLGLAGSRAAEGGMLGKGEPLASERGSFSFRPDGTKYTPEEIFLARQLKNAPLEKVKAAAAELEGAALAERPLFLPEAVGSAKVDRNARFIANYEPSMDFSQGAIGARTAAAEGRASELFNAVSPDADAFSGANKLKQAASDIIGAAEQSREDLVKPLYGAAYREVPTVNNPAFTELLEKDSVLRSAISNVKKTANNADLPTNSTQLLVKARNEISNKIEAALNKGASREARDLTDTYQRLNKILHENPQLKAADEAYAAASENISALTDTFLKNLSSITDDKVQNVGQIFNLPAERIKTLRGSFEAAGKLDEWNAGIRAHLQNVVEGSREGQNFTHKLTGNTIQKDKLKAALGDSYETVAKGLSYENRFAEGKNKYFAGPSTFGNFSEEAAFQKGAGMLEKIGRGDYLGAIKGLFTDTDMPEELAQKMARIYFDTTKGKDALNKIVPLLEDYARVKMAAGAGSLAGAKAGAVEAGLFASGTQESPPPLVSKSTQPSATKADPKLAEKISRVTGGASFEPTSSQASDDYSFMNTMFKGDKMDSKAAQVIEEIKKDPIDHAIMLMESAGDPKAKNPDSSASGLFQLIKSTAKDLGVDDVFDARQNYDGYKKLKEQTIKEFGTDDVKMIYASHYLGAPTLRKWIDGKALTEAQEKQVKYLKNVLFPRLEKIYNGLIDDGGQTTA